MRAASEFAAEGRRANNGVGWPGEALGPKFDEGSLQELSNFHGEHVKLTSFPICSHEQPPKPPSGDLKGCLSKMAPRKLKPRSRKIRESFCEDLLPRKLAKETFKAQNPCSSLFRQFPRMYPDPYHKVYSQISTDIAQKSAKASRKIRERSAKAVTSWDGPLPRNLVREWQCPLRSGSRA